MEKFLMTTLVLLLCIAPAGSLKGMENAKNSTGQMYQSEVSEQKSEHSPEVEDYGTVVEFDGLPVLSPSGEEIGKMQNIVTDRESGLIHFFTITQSGDSGNQKKIAVPYGVVRFYSDRAVLSVDPDKLKSAPQQAGLSDAEFQRDLESHYGISPSW